MPSGGAGHKGQELVSEPKVAEGGLCPSRRAETQYRISELDQGEGEILMGTTRQGVMKKLSEVRRAVAQGPGSTVLETKTIRTQPMEVCIST